VIIPLRTEVALDCGRSQEPLDSFGLPEAIIDCEPDVRRKFQVDALSNLAAQESPVAVQRGEHRIGIVPAERHGVDGRKPQIRGHAHLGNGDDMALEHGIMHVTASKHLGEHMPHELAYAQLPL
jgi:hypothetical protein